MIRLSVKEAVTEFDEVDFVPRRAGQGHKPRRIRDLKSYSSPALCDVQCQTEQMTEQSAEASK